MTRFELPDAELHHTVEEVIGLYDQAQSSVFKLMASVSDLAPASPSKCVKQAAHDYTGFCAQIPPRSELPPSPSRIQRKNGRGCFGWSSSPATRSCWQERHRGRIVSEKE